MVGGVVIRMPTNDIKAYLDTVIKPEKLMSDHQMVHFLEQELQKCRVEKMQPLNSIQKLEKEVLGSKFFEKLPESA